MRAPSIAKAFGMGNKTIPVLVVLLILSIVSGSSAIVYITIQTDYEKQYLRAAKEQQLLSQRLATHALESAAGKKSAFLQLKRQRDAFDALMSKITQGDKQTGLPTASKSAYTEINDVEKSWNEFRKNIDTILNGKASISSLNSFTEVIDKATPRLVALSDEIAAILVKDKAEPQQIYIASRQLMITQRIENSLSRMLAGGESAATAADRFGRDAALYGQVLRGLLKGNKALNIGQIKNPGAREKLAEIAEVYKGISLRVGAILEASPELFKIKNAASSIERISAQLLHDTEELENSILRYGDSIDLLTVLAYALGGVSVIMLIVIGYLLMRATRKRLEVTAEQNRRNQRAILRLLDEMTNLAEGDLTVHATVTEDITGAIADSVNYSIDALRNLVTTINKTAVQVSSASERAQGTAQRLADASGYQAREIASASAAITDMAESIEQVSKNAASSADVAHRSVKIAHKGAKMVSRTIDGMGTIREQIQETSKRIKRLGESSQEIGDIVSLINEIADQTNILALNAAIQASTAGEAGRGFAVVADEVQRLAERAGNATKQIEALVKTIQTDTNEAVISMEHSTANVVGGAKLAEDAGEALTEIETVSNQLAGLIQSISQAARQQSSAAANITNTMNVIQEITMQTSEGTNETAGSVGKLTELANDLRHSVAGFKLPDSGEVDTVVMEQRQAQS
jgi:twitching motility protein PilJ